MDERFNNDNDSPTSIITTSSQKNDDGGLKNKRNDSQDNSNGTSSSETSPTITATAEERKSSSIFRSPTDRTPQRLAFPQRRLSSPLRPIISGKSLPKAVPTKNNNNGTSTSTNNNNRNNSINYERYSIGRDIPYSYHGHVGSHGSQFATPKSFSSAWMQDRPKTPADEGLSERDVVRRISEHLVDVPKQITPAVGSVSHSLLGGDTTRDIYQWNEKRTTPSIRRRNSDPEICSIALDPEAVRASDLREPGVFRRHFVKTRAATEGRNPPGMITENFIDFLALYGLFGGDVYPSDDEIYDEADYMDADDGEEYLQIEGNEEEQPLIQANQPPLRKQGSLTTIHGTTPKKAFFMLMKAFVGTGVLFLPKAFANGGLGFSIILLIFIGWLTLYCMLLLVETSRELGGSFGDLGEKLYGPRVKQLVVWSIAISQMGFCCAYYIFVAQNLRDITMVASNCKWIFPDWVFIVVQVFMYIPLAWVRRIKNFSFSSLIADVFILIGLGYIFYFNMKRILTFGVTDDFVWFNLKSFPLFVGTSLFAFEGICLILPIAESMKEPEKFGNVMTWCIVTIGAIFIVIGVSGYLTFGNKVATIIFLNLPTESGTVTFIQFIYILAIMLSFPLTVYPAIRITEQKIFGRSTGKNSNLIKWQKNFYRASLVAFLAAVAFLGSDNLDKFVSLVGCFACIPLSFIYPALFHYHIAKSNWRRLLDIAIIMFGAVAMGYTTYVTIQQWVVNEPDTPINRCLP